MSNPSVGQEEYLDAQSTIYRELAQQLYDMLDADQQDALRHLELVVLQETAQGANGQSFRVTYVPADGPSLPLIARPGVIELCRQLDTLARHRFSGSTWDSFTYVLSAGTGGPTFECRYTYPTNIH